MKLKNEYCNKIPFWTRPQGHYENSKNRYKRLKIGYRSLDVGETKSGITANTIKKWNFLSVEN